MEQTKAAAAVEAKVEAKAAAQNEAQVTKDEAAAEKRYTAHVAVTKVDPTSGETMRLKVHPQALAAHVAAGWKREG